MSIADKLTAIAERLIMSIANKLTAVAENVPKVYEAGKQAEHDAYWGDFQDDGKRTNCRAMFAGTGWNIKTFRPEHKTTPSSNLAVFMFYFFNSGAPEKLDYRNFKHLFDFSQITNANGLFQDAGMDYIDIDLSNVTNAANAFAEGYYAGVKTHITLKLSEKCTGGLATAFNYCSGLTDLLFAEGSVIAASINLQYSPLTKASFTSVIDALSSTVSGQTATFKKTAKEAAFTADEWATLIATKSNWTISLV